MERRGWKIVGGAAGNAGAGANAGVGGGSAGIGTGAGVDGVGVCLGSMGCMGVCCVITGAGFVSKLLGCACRKSW